MRGYALPLAIVLVCAIALPSSLAAQQTATLRGRVLAEETRKPIPGATVILREAADTTKTSSTGSFMFGGVRAGEYTLAVFALGHKPYDRHVSIGAAQPEEIEITMTATPAVLTAVVTTATRTAAEVRDVPAPVNVLTDTAISQSGATNFQEAMRTVPGVSMGSFGENFNSIQMRGVPRFGNENEGTLILLDGVPQTDARNSAQILTIPIDNIDNVEVVKGPNSALYGRTAIGGVVSIFTQDPPPTNQFTADVQTGQWGLIRGALTATGPVATGSKAGYLVSWSGDDHEWYSAVESYHKHDENLFGKFTTPLGSSTHFVAEADVASSLGGTPTGDPLVGGPGTGGPPGSQPRLLSSVDPGFSPYTDLNLPSAEYNEEHVRTMATIRHEFSATSSITNIFGYRHSFYQFQNDGDYLVGPATPSGDTVTLYPFSRTRQEDAYYDDMRTEFSLGPAAFRNHMLFGGTVDRNTGVENTQTVFSDPVSEGVPIDYRDPVYPTVSQLQVINNGTSLYQGTYLSLYGQDEITILRRLQLTGGLRYDHDAIIATLEAPGASSQHISVAGHQFSPKGTASLRVLDPTEPGGTELNIYAAYATAFRPGYEPEDITVSYNPKNPVANENIQNYEGGVKGSTLNDLLAFDVSAFSMLRDGIQILLPGAQPNTYIESPAGQEKFAGVETEVDLFPTAYLSLHAFYAYYNGIYGRFTYQATSGSVVDLEGLRVNLSPHDMINVNGNYAIGPLDFTLTGLYDGNEALDPQNFYLMPPSFALNGRVSYRWRRYMFAVAVDNILNRVNFYDGEITAPLYAFPGPPRRVLAEIKAAF